MAIKRIPELPKNCKNLTGRRFGHLVVKWPTNQRKNRRIVWFCACDCGDCVEVRSRDLLSGNTRSCGCLKKLIGERTATHGMSKTPIYGIWKNMIRRCEDLKRKEYKYYGGRGITVCERWHKIENFYKDVGDPPKGKSIDRWPDNDGNYEPTNWRWATREEQRINSRPASCGPFQQRWFRAWHKDMMCQFMSNSQNKFAEQRKLSGVCVSLCLSGKQKSHRGWTFCRIGA